MVCEQLENIQCTSDKETSERAESLLKLATQCVYSDRKKEACHFLDIALSAVPRPLHRLVSQTFSTVFSTATLECTDFVLSSLSIVKTIMDKNIPIASETCSRIVHGLVQLGEETEARSLVSSAIERGWYKNNKSKPYSLVLSPTLNDLEIVAIIRHHVLELPHPPTHPLEVLCSAGM